MNQSQSNKDKIRYLACPSVLNKTNPEIFSSKPRPGGLLVSFMKECKNQPDTSRTDAVDLTLDVYHSTSREYRLTSALEECNWSMSGSDVAESFLGEADPLKDCIDMLAVTITTIMFMAADAVKDVSRQHLNWTIQYLKCIQDEFGNIPPNARGILNHLKHTFGDLSQFEERPMAVDESGRVVDEFQMPDMSKTERVVIQVSHKPEGQEEGEAPPPES